VNWREGTDTMTAGEIVSWSLNGDEIMIESNLAKNVIYLNRDQALSMVAGLCHLVNQVGPEKMLGIPRVLVVPAAEIDAMVPGEPRFDAAMKRSEAGVLVVPAEMELEEGTWARP
jgi:hypothetical protein